MTVDKPKIVVAGTVEQYYNYCRENNLQPGVDALYVINKHVLRARIITEDQIVRVGTYMERDDLFELETLIESYIARGPGARGYR